MYINFSEYGDNDLHSILAGAAVSKSLQQLHVNIYDIDIPGTNQAELISLLEKNHTLKSLIFMSPLFEIDDEASLIAALKKIHLS